MTLEEAEKLLSSKTCEKSETIKITVDSKEPFKRTPDGQSIVFKGVRGEILKFEPPATYTVMVKAAALKLYFAKNKKG